MREKISGVCGKEIMWELERQSGHLVIDGIGAMTDYDEEFRAPWYLWRNEITEVIVREGVTMLGEYAFHECEKVTRVSLPSTMDVLGFYSLSRLRSLKEIVLPEGVRVLESRVFNDCTGLETIHIPLSLKSVDLKCFIHCDALRQVIYAGSEEQWKRIGISDAGLGNVALLKAQRSYGQAEQSPEPAAPCTAELLWNREKTVVVPVQDIVRDLLKKGGDGRLHVLGLEMRISGLKEKSGDCSLIIFPDGQTMLVDMGVGKAEPKVLGMLDKVGLKRLDYMVISHCHQDHVGNGLAVAGHIYGKGGSIGTYCYVDIRYGRFEPPLADYLQEQGVEMRTKVCAGDVWQIGKVKVEVLGPTREHTLTADLTKPGAAEVNNISQILKFRYGKNTFLMAGDLFRPQERKVVREYKDRLKADVIKANHHGIATSNSEEWIDATDPVLVYACTDDMGGTVLSERLEKRGAQYFTTGLCGSVLISMWEDGRIEAVTEYGDRFVRD